jgi:hypothetical protein
VARCLPNLKELGEDSADARAKLEPFVQLVQREGFRHGNLRLLGIDRLGRYTP